MRNPTVVPVGRRRRRGLGLEVGGGGVEEQQVDFQVQQVRRRPVHRLGQVGLHLQQPVHRPIAAVIVDIVQAGDGDALGHPLRGGQLRGRLQRPVGDQCEQHPLHPGIDTAPAEQPLQRGVDAEAAPQLIEDVGAAHRTRVGELSPAAAAAAASAGSSTRDSDSISRAIAARSSRSSRPKLYSIRAPSAPPRRPTRCGPGRDSAPSTRPCSAESSSAGTWTRH